MGQLDSVAFEPGGGVSSCSVISFSGGKDSCLALFRARQAGFCVNDSLTALDETGDKTRSHGVSKALMGAQALALGLNPHYIAATWADYESLFTQRLVQFRSLGVAHAIFGDIDLLAHKEWEEKVCLQSGLRAQLPLWNQDREQLVAEFLGLGFKARVVCVDGRFLDASYVGREFNQDYLDDLPDGVDACGENGEFHTFVYDGPGFAQPVAWLSLGHRSYTSPPEYGSQIYYFDLLDHRQTP